MEHSPTTSGPSHHRQRASLGTSASGIADSTISFNTYATGITDGSLCLSQFPPPPVDLPITPISDRFFPSPTRSTFTITPPQFVARGTERSLHSPAQSTFTVASHPSVGPALPSPAQSTFTVSASAPATPRGLMTSAVHQPSGLNREVVDESFPPDHSTGRTQHSGPRARPQSPTSLVGASKLSPYDWHDGSSTISVDPNEERMLSTSFITGLLSSAPSVNASSVSQMPRPPYQADTGSLVSEMFYPPPSRYHNPGFGSSRFPTDSYTSAPPSEGPGSHFNVENDSITSYNGYSEVVQPGSSLTRKVSVVGMAQATLRHVPSATSVPESIHHRSQDTYRSTSPLNSPLNSHPLSAFWMDGARPTGVQPADVQPFVSTFQPSTSATPLIASVKPSTKRQRRVSTLSTRTVKSHVSSLISSAGQRSARAARAMMEWMQIKPLPPVPTIPNTSLYQEQEHRRMEDSVPLPILVERAGRLNAMLDSGRLPDDTFSKLASEKVASSQAYTSGFGVTSGSQRFHSMTFSSGRELENPYGRSKANSKSFFKRPMNRNRIRLFVGIFIFVLLVIIGIIVGVTVGHKHSPSCPINRTGNACNLDSTCVCVSSNTTQCKVLAQSLVSLIPIVNDQFNANFTLAVVANAMSSSQAPALSSDCAAQAQLVDVSPALNPQTVPNRTTWAQSTLLWSFVLSQNTSSVQSLRSFVTKANWKSLPGDGPVTGQSSKFSTTQLGYVFDFAAQTISEPPVSFISDGQPSSSQLAEVGSIAGTSLDRMYTFASASSTIQSTAMENYWQYTLQQDPNDYINFVSLLISSPILLPFDANGTAGNIPISSLLTNSSSAPFPPPLSCYPSLATSQRALITNLETSVFGLSPPSVQTSFNNSCFADRPIYGVLDILHSRLPFPDSQTGTAKQAAILSRDASPRVVVYNGEVLSSLPNSNVSSIPTTDPRRFGTLKHMNHVLLNFFETIPDLNVAIQLVKYVLSSVVTPPPSNTLLGQSLGAIPTLEVAIFGSVTPPDLEGVVSSFATPSGGLFFGSDDSLAVRDWAIVGVQKSVTWTEFANSPEIVNDNSLTDNTFNSVWDPAFLFFHSSTNATVDVRNITTAFTAVDKFTST